jgi:hypothetical protein
VSQRKAGKATPRRRHRRILGQRLALEQGEGHRPGLEEGNRLLAGRRFPPTERLVERPAAGQVGDAERDEADGLLHDLDRPVRTNLAF